MKKEIKKVNKVIKSKSKKSLECDFLVNDSTLALDFPVKEVLPTKDEIKIANKYKNLKRKDLYSINTLWDKLGFTK